MSDWTNYDMDPISPLLPKGGTVPVAEYTSPNHDGPRKSTVGVVIHATLSGTSTSLENEYQATINWFQNPASQVSSHAIVGPGGKVFHSVRPEMIAWHAKAANADHLSLEMTKIHLGDSISPDILDAAAKIVAAWCTQYSIPIVWSASHGIEEHRNIPGNDHQDVGGPFDRADFLARVRAHAAPPLNVAEVGIYAQWVTAALANSADEVRGTVGLQRFTAHLQGIGADSHDPYRYGWAVKPTA